MFYYNLSIYLNLLIHRSRSNNDLLGLDKNADTASLRSLPMNSSIPCLDLTSGVPQQASSDNNIGGGISFDASLTSSPISSPAHETKGKQDKIYEKKKVS